MRRDPARGRRVLLWTIGITVIATAVVTVILTVLALSSSASTADKLAAAGDVLVGATLLLAAIAAMVALLAYAVSTGSPDLQISVLFTNSPPNNPVFEGSFHDAYVTVAELLSGEHLGRILLQNTSGYSAKNPTVRIWLNAMAFRPSHSSFFQEWDSMDVADIFLADVNAQLITAVQWDGGATYSIHGHSTRRLPDLQFTRLWKMSNQGPPVLTFEILADGYRRVVPLPVDFIVEGKSLFPREDGKVNPRWM